LFIRKDVLFARTVALPDVEINILVWVGDNPRHSLSGVFYYGELANSHCSVHHSYSPALSAVAFSDRRRLAEGGSGGWLRAPCSLLYHLQFLTNLLKGPDRLIKMFLFMGCRKLYSYPGFAFGYNRIRKANHINTFIKKP
jgi:hypothetical protein